MSKTFEEKMSDPEWLELILHAFEARIPVSKIEEYLSKQTTTKN